MNLNQVINERYSVRKFKPQMVSDVLLKQVVEAGRMAPSACNLQPWVFVIVFEAEVLEQIHKAYPREWFIKTNQVIVVCGNHEQSWKRSFDNKDHCDIDVAIAIDHMTLKATALGLGTCWVCNFNSEIIKDTLNLPHCIEPIALLPIGYPDSEPTAEKIRKPFDDIVFFNRYK
ncbi:MAG: nitroreductase family protein [Marinilabiliaceae bacterium]|nr:nitroreductase family protein [Marinilabiliaceae bacterium]